MIPPVTARLVSLLWLAGLVGGEPALAAATAPDAGPLVVVEAGKTRPQTTEEIALKIAKKILDRPMSPAQQQDRLQTLLREATPDAVSAITPTLIAKWSEAADSLQLQNMTTAAGPGGDIVVTGIICTPDMNNCYTGKDHVIVHGTAGERATRITLLSDH